MNYIENIYVCLAIPVLVAVFCADRRRRPSLLFLLSGMTACLFSSYISTFLTELLGPGFTDATVSVTPIVEECMKIVPVLFCLLVFESPRHVASNGILMTAVGFATFENVCYLTTNGAENLRNLLIRGASTGAMHITCGFLIGLGLLYFWDRLWIQAAGTVALVCLAIVYHATFNVLVDEGGAFAFIGYLLPMLTLIPAVSISRRLMRRSDREPEPEYDPTQ